MHPFCARAARSSTRRSIDESKLRNKKSLNVALLGVLSRHLQFSEQEWLAAIRRILPEALHEANLQAFQLGRSV